MGEGTTEEEGEETKTQVKQILEKWESMSSKGSLVYVANRKNRHALLKDASEVGLDPDDGFATQWSMRDVDRESNLYLI